MLVTLLLSIDFVNAQGILSGSFETNSIYYQDDAKTGAIAPDNKLGSNNYFKLDYQYKKFQAGIQYEAYLPVLQGFPSTLRNSGLVFKYASFQDSSLSITAGDFYEQFGNGLIFRAYEERSIGLNTSLEGVRLAYAFRNLIRVKALLGRPREFMEKAPSNVKGASVLFDLASIFKLKRSTANVEFNVIDRYENYEGQDRINPNVQAYSLNADWNVGSFNFQGEYAYKTKDNSVYTNNLNKDGTALLLQAGFNKPGFGSNLSFRRLEYMQFGTSRGIAGVGRDLNYLPALTKQHNYSLALINPYNTMANSEIGGQLDVQYQLKPGSSAGGKYGTQLSFNASTYYNLDGNVIDGFKFFSFGYTKYYQDINLELEKRMNAKVLTHFFYANQVFNPVVVGKENKLYTSHIVAGDLLWQWKSERSIRVELQHLWSKDYQKNWAAALFEYSPLHAWTCFAGDNYNYGETGIHYYRLGGSYSFSRTRIAMTYGRNREGNICAGGVCLYMPAYTGLNLAITSSF